ncbi:MAG TPA: hypothetical protein VGM54_16480 [Chthoniobacter sp.]
MADHHILGIADERGGGADVAGDGQGDQERYGVEPFSHEGRRDDRREDVADDVVVQDRGEAAGREHENEEKARRVSETFGNPDSHFVVEARQTKLGREDKETEEQTNRRPVDGRNGVLGGDAAENHHGDCAEQDDSDAVEFQPRDVAHGDPEISDRENSQDYGTLVLVERDRGEEGGHGATDGRG